MVPIQIREKLHEYIDNADEKKIEAIYNVLAEGIAGEYNYSNEEIAELYARRKNFQEQKEEVLSTSQFVQYVINNKL